MAHDLRLSGHPGKGETYKLLSQYYFWPKIIDSVERFIGACHGCKHAKAFNTKYQGLLHPLPVPIQQWADIAIDFVVNLPPCKRHGRTYKNILMIICQLTKERHYVPTEGVAVSNVTDAFLREVYRLHGLPDSITSDQGTQFGSDV